MDHSPRLYKYIRGQEPRFVYQSREIHCESLTARKDLTAILKQNISHLFIRGTAFP